MNDFIELSQVLKVVLKRWWIIVAVGVLAAGLGYFVSKQQAPVYQATSTLLVGQFMQSSNVNRADIQTSAEVAKTYADIITRQPVLSEVVKQMGLSMRWQTLKKQIRVKILEGTQLIEITVEAESPDMAAKIADQVADQMIKISPTSVKLSDNYDIFLRAQIDSLQQKIVDHQGRVKEIETSLLKNPTEIEKISLQTEKTTEETLITGWQKNYIDLTTLVHTEGISNNFLSKIEPAQAQSSPVRPRILINTALSGGIGVVLALCGLFLLEFFNDTYRTREELEKVKDLNLLGSIGKISGKSQNEKIISALKPFSPITEAYNMIRSKIQFKLPDNPTRSIIVTSPVKGEGKSLTAVNLGIVMAKAGYKTLLVDADLRQPTLHQIFDLENVHGLANALSEEEVDVTSLIQTTPIDNLAVLPSGAAILNPTEQLGSDRMLEIITCLERTAEVVIFDSPPALLVADATILSNHTDGVVLVLKASKTRRTEVRQVLRHFQHANANVLGCILNQAEAKNGSYAGYEVYGKK